MKAPYLIIGILVLAAFAAAETNVLIIADSSVSMSARIDGVPKIDIAKEVLIEYLTSAEGGNMGLMLYGHRTTSCDDIELVLPIGSDKSDIASAVEKMKPVGMTPIGQSMREAVTHLPSDGDNYIILVSDGEETCAGDPCAAVEELRAAGANFILYAIGFDISEQGREELQCMADEYYDAKDAGELRTAFIEVTTLNIPKLNIPRLCVPSIQEIRPIEWPAPIGGCKSITPMRIEDCEAISNSYCRSQCLMDLASRTSDLAACAMAASRFTLDCALSLTPKPSQETLENLCEDIETRFYKYDCYARLAELYCDTDLCSKAGDSYIFACAINANPQISNQDIRELCLFTENCYHLDQCLSKAESYAPTGSNPACSGAASPPSQPAPSSTTPPTAPASASGMTEHCYTEHGICFSLPSGWQEEDARFLRSLIPELLLYFSQPDNPLVSINLVGEDLPFSVKSNIHDVSETQYRSVIATGSTSQGIDVEILSFQKKTIDGMQVIETVLSTSLLGTEARQKQLSYIHAGKWYALTLSATEDTYASYESDFNSVLASIRFPSAQAHAPTSQESGDDSFIWIILIVVIIAAVAVVILLLVLNRRPEEPMTPRGGSQATYPPAQPAVQQAPPQSQVQQFPPIQEQPPTIPQPIN
jgi:hypothetical protein